MNNIYCVLNTYNVIYVYWELWLNNNESEIIDSLKGKSNTGNNIYFILYFYDDKAPSIAIFTIVFTKLSFKENVPHLQTEMVQSILILEMQNVKKLCIRNE